MPRPRLCYSCCSCSPLALLLALALLGFSAGSLSASEVPIYPSDLTLTLRYLLTARSQYETLESDYKQAKTDTLRLSESLREADAKLAEAEANLRTVNDSLARAEASLQRAEQSSTASWEATRQARVLYTDLVNRFGALSASFDDLRSRVLGLERSRGVWRVVGLGGILAAVICGILAAVR